jgi:predicted phage replisome organizer
MPDIKWIKITTEMFDDEKIRIIEAMPEADTLIVLWIRLVCMAGKVNAGGYIFLAPNLPYNDEQLAAVFNRPLNTVRLALDTFQHLQMIELSENGNIFLPNFSKHQNIQGMERARELAAARNREYRKRQKEERLVLPEGSDVTMTSRDAVDKIRKEEIRKELEIWNNVLIKIKKTITKANYDAWFKDTSCIEISDSDVIIGVAEEFTAKHIEETSRSLIERLVQEETGLSLSLRMVLIEKI